MKRFIRVKVSDSGRVRLPTELRRELGIEKGEELLMTRTKYGVQLSTTRDSVRQAQDIVRKYVPTVKSPVSEPQAAPPLNVTLA